MIGEFPVRPEHAVAPFGVLQQGHDRLTPVWIGALQPMTGIGGGGRKNRLAQTPFTDVDIDAFDHDFGSAGQGKLIPHGI
jgi:hypothetical protein